MSQSRLETTIAAAIAEGILPPAAAHTPVPYRPWPVILLTGIGAWLVALPLLSVVFLTMNGILGRGAGPYVIGTILTVGGAAMLRNKQLPLFVEQLMAPLLLAGYSVWTFAAYDDLPRLIAGTGMAAIAIGLGLALARQWLRLLLGAAACGQLIFALTSRSFDQPQHYWLALHGVLLLWMPFTLRGRMPALQAMSSGWIATVLAGLAVWSGVTFLAGAHLGGTGASLVVSGNWHAFMQAGSAALAVVAMLWLRHEWASLRAPWASMSGAILVALAWLMPALGAVLLILSVCATRQHWKTAIAAGLAAAWIAGAFYYQLSYPLGIKAIMLFSAGAMLGLIAWWALRGQASAGQAPALASTRLAKWAIGATAAAVLLVANTAISQKETLIAQGRPVFFELAPVDPRSLMQGDFMRLNYRARVDDGQSQRRALSGATRLRMVGRLDARGVFTHLRTGPAVAAGPGEIMVELTPTSSGWTVASDAWFFEEGEAARWEKAQYGEFRIDQQGRALLVGLRGPSLEPL